MGSEREALVRVRWARDLAPFAAWLPAELASAAIAPRAEARSLGSAIDKKGVPLSQLLAGVTQAVASAYRAGVWTMVEVVQVSVRGHVYLEVAERAETGAGQSLFGIGPGSIDTLKRKREEQGGAFRLA